MDHEIFSKELPIPAYRKADWMPPGWVDKDDHTAGAVSSVEKPVSRTKTNKASATKATPKRKYERKEKPVKSPSADKPDTSLVQPLKEMTGAITELTVVQQITVEHIKAFTSLLELISQPQRDRLVDFVITTNTIVAE